MRGGLDNDVFVVDNAGDTVIENAAEGTADRIESFISLSLNTAGHANVEHLTLLGGAGTAIGNALENELTGNQLGNELIGEAGDDTLNGGGGVDTMRGGADDDMYIVDNSADQVFESAGGGSDFVVAATSFELPSEVESLTLVDSAFLGIGNSVGNGIVGNDAANRLEGRGGRDILVGEGGDDVLDGGVLDDTMNGGGRERHPSGRRRCGRR